MKYFKAGVLMLLLCIISGLQNGVVYGNEDNGFIYYFIGEEEISGVMIFDYNGKEEHLVIPEELGGYPVKDVELWGLDEEGQKYAAIKSITLPSGVEEFRISNFTALTDIFVDEKNETYQSIDGVLYSKDGTTMIKCPDGRAGRFEIKEGALSVEMSAFSPLTTEIYLPESFKDTEELSIALKRFCPDLQNIYVSDKNPMLCVEDNILYTKDKKTLLICLARKEGVVNIPVNVEVISDGAFSRCSKIEKIIMPDTVNSVGDHAFYDCSSLTDIKLSSNLTSLGYMIFNECTQLNRLVIPAKLVSISSWTFDGCHIKELVIEDGNESLSVIDGMLFSEKGKVLIKCFSEDADEINLPEGVVRIESDAFYNCRKITKVTLPDSVTQMGSSAFMNCSSLKEIILSQNLTNISYEAFSSCYSLEEIVIPASVTDIESFAFDDCTNLKKVWIESIKIDYFGGYLFGFDDCVTQVYVYDENLYSMLKEDYDKNVILVKKTEPLELSMNSVTLYTGNKKKSATVKAVLTDIKGTVKWSTSDKSVATVKNGKIIAVKKGRAIITAKVGKYKKTVSVTVKNPAIVVADGSESINSIKLKRGETAYYHVSVNPKGSKLKLEIGKNSKKTARITLKNNTLAVKGMKKGTINFKLICGLGSKKIVVKVR